MAFWGALLPLIKYGQIKSFVLFLICLTPAVFVIREISQEVPTERLLVRSNTWVPIYAFMSRNIVLHPPHKRQKTEQVVSFQLQIQNRLNGLLQKSMVKQKPYANPFFS